MVMVCYANNHTFGNTERIEGNAWLYFSIQDVILQNISDGKDILAIEVNS